MLYQIKNAMHSNKWWNGYSKTANEDKPHIE